MERKQEICSPFVPRRNVRTKTSAEIVREVRQSLRVQSTQRPETPRDGHRQLFGKSSVRADREDRPPSSFSVHAQNFDAPDSRPGSGVRLSPLEHKPKLPVPCHVEAFPKRPTDPDEVKSQGAGAQALLLRARSLTSLSPLEGDADGKQRLNPGSGQKQPSAKRLPGTNHTGICSVPHKHSAAAGESRARQPDGDSGGRPTSGWRAELGHGDDTRQDAESLVWDGTIAPILRQLESLAAGSSVGSPERLCDACCRLHGALADADMLGRRCKKTSRILRTLFRLIDLGSARLNLHVAALCLALCVSGNNLLNICKLVFQISRSESNDVLFQSDALIDSLLGILGSEDVSTHGEALLYCVGTLKFLSGNAAILRLLLDRNCIGVAQKLIQRLRMADDSNFTMAGHILVQLTATLRNLADLPASQRVFVSLSVLPELCAVLRLHCRDQDICTNISRIFSKLSSYSECCLALAQTPDCHRLFLDLLAKHHQKQDLVVRLLFTLGNLTAESDEARLRLFRCDGGLETLLRLYDGHQRRGGPPLPPRRPQEGDDVLVKLVRVLANMSVHRAVGPALANSGAFIQLLMETLDLRSVLESEELMVNVAAAISNLTFYQEGSSELRRRRLAIAELMLQLMLSSSMDAMLEATRVYGNLTLHRDVRDFIMHSKVHQFIVTLLDSKSTDLCYSASGVLTNLALDPPNRVILALEGAAAKLVDCLRDLGPGDWQLAAQACQALWNLIGGGEAAELLDAAERESLLDVLTSFSDEDEALRGVRDEDLRDFHRACREIEFLPVAQTLMKTLQPDRTA